MRLCLVFLAVASLFLAPDQGDETKKELEKLKGTWKFVSIEVDGMKLPDDATADTQLVLDGDKFTLIESGTASKGTFTVDVTKKPKTIDAVFIEGPEKGKKCLGIYELEGDTYKVCIGMPGVKDRPKEFATKKDSGHVLEVLMRVKK